MARISPLGFEVILTREAKTALAEGKTWSGRLLVRIKGDQRVREFEAQRREGRARESILSTDDSTVVDHWNKSSLVTAGLDKFQRKNLPAETPLTQTNKKTLERSLKLFDVSQIKKFIDVYLRRCEKGDHVYRNRNVAYKDLFGLLRKINTVKTNHDFAWWMPAGLDPSEAVKLADTPESKLVLALANAYAKKFLGVEVYPTAIKVRDLEALKRACRAIASITNRFPVKPERAIHLLLDCARETYPNGTVYLAHLGGSTFLSNALVQHVKGIFG